MAGDPPDLRVLTLLECLYSNKKGFLNGSLNQ